MIRVNQQESLETSSSTTNTQNINIIKSLSYITGVYFGDGCIVMMPKFRQYIFLLSTIDRDFTEALNKAFKEVFGKGGNIYLKDYSKSKIKRQNQWCLRIYSKRACQFLRRITKLKTQIPRYVSKNKDTLKEFIAGVMDSEGCVNLSKMPNGKPRYRIGIGACDSWIHDFKSVLRMVNVYPKKTIVKKKGKHGKRPFFYYYFNRKSFLDSGCYFKIKRKQDRLDKIRLMIKNGDFKVYKDRVCLS